jgi:hypothetical protein
VFSYIQGLHLSNNHRGPEGAACVVGALSAATHLARLQDLDLGNNYMGWEGVAIVADMLQASLHLAIRILECQDDTSGVRVDGIPGRSARL